MTAKPKYTAYSNTPLPKKLGLLPAKRGALQVVGIGMPPGFIESLGELPENVRFREDMTNHTGLALCFVRTRRDLEATIGMLAAKLPRGTSAWMIWPKAHHKPGFNGNDVRNIALPQGLVDYKICSIDADWSGMKFAWRKI